MYTNRVSSCESCITKKNHTHSSLASYLTRPTATYWALVQSRISMQVDTCKAIRHRQYKSCRHTHSLIVYLHLPTLIASWDLSSRRVFNPLLQAARPGLTQSSQLEARGAWPSNGVDSSIPRGRNLLNEWADDDIPPNITANAVIREGKSCICSYPTSASQGSKGHSMTADLRIYRCTIDRSHSMQTSRWRWPEVPMVLWLSYHTYHTASKIPVDHA